MLYESLEPGSEFQFTDDKFSTDKVIYGIKVDDTHWRYNTNIHGDFFEDLNVGILHDNWEITPL